MKSISIRRSLAASLLIATVPVKADIRNAMRTAQTVIFPVELRPAPLTANAIGSVNRFELRDLPRRRVEQDMFAVLTDALPATAADLPAELSIPSVSARSSITAPRWMVAPRTPWKVRNAWRGCHLTAYRPSGLLDALAEVRRFRLHGLVRDIACDHGLPHGLFDALIISESAYRTTALSPKLAYGLTQLMSATAQNLGVDRYTIDGNLRGGARYLRQQLDRFGRYDLALAAYNAGPHRVRGGRIPAIAETRTYVARVLAFWSRLEGNRPLATPSRSAVVVAAR